MECRSFKISFRYSLQLLFISASTLYLELAVIRFSAAEVLHLGFFSNFVLISVFVGLGLGFLAVDYKTEFKKYFPFALVILFIFILFSGLDAGVFKDQKVLFFFGLDSNKTGLMPTVILLPILFIMTVFLFTILGQQTARMFKHFSPLKAYTLDILGSLCGIIIFSWQCLNWSSPVTWIITSTLLMIFVNLLDFESQGRKRSIYIVLASFCILTSFWVMKSPYKTVWSFYQKIQFASDNLLSFPYTNSQSRIYVNGIPHQFLSKALQANQVHYGIPYRFFDNNSQEINDVLIIGAGSGTDISVALLNGVKKIDAVEIDAGIISIGKEYHPDKPFEDDRVNLFIRDGREFLRNSRKKYDLIIFALPDSLLRFSPLSSVRLESYLFTLESFYDVKNHLKENGIFVLYNLYRWAWLKDRLSSMVLEVFQQKPVQIEYGLYTVFGVKRIDSKNIKTNLSLRGFSLPIDDWPFFYLKYPGIPWFYIGMIGMFLGAACIGIWFFAPKGTLRQPQWSFFFMGVAFLLLETKSISTFALLFGTTWAVNSLAFIGVLISILLANGFVYYSRIQNRVILFTLLFGALLVAYFYPPAKFLGISNPTFRYILVVVLVFSPIFFANILFTKEFRDTKVSTKAFGWNILGAVLGGGLEYLSLLVGNRNLLLIVALMYVLTACTFREKKQMI